MKIKVNRDQLEEQIESVIRRAEGWYSQGGSGECQLYARFDEDDTVYDFFIADHAGHNSWEEGDNIRHIHTQRWFSWHEHEDLGEWLAGELEPFSDNQDIRKQFISYLQEQGYDEEDIKSEWWRFEDFNVKKWNEFMDQWREIWMDEYIRVKVPEVMEQLEKSGEWDIRE